MVVSKIKTLLKNYYLISKGRSLSLKKEVELKCKWYGNNYGGFYLHDLGLNEHSVVYSFGIGQDISFDLQVIKEFKSQVFGFDPTPKSIRWVKSQQHPAEFNFFEYGIGKETGNITFYLPKNKEYVSGSVLSLHSLNVLEPVSVPMKNFQDIVTKLGHQQIDVLKMDIEGAEYEIIPEILKSGIEIKQILIEFHHRMVKNGGELTKKAIDDLRKNGFELFAYSDSSEELSFVNKKYIKA